MSAMASDGAKLKWTILKESVIFDDKKSKHPVPLSPHSVRKLQHRKRIEATGSHCSIKGHSKDKMDGKEIDDSSASSSSSSVRIAEKRHSVSLFVMNDVVLLLLLSSFLSFFHLLKN
jgi:hypothetical protein